MEAANFVGQYDLFDRKNNADLVQVVLDTVDDQLRNHLMNSFDKGILPCFASAFFRLMQMVTLDTREVRMQIEAKTSAHLPQVVSSQDPKVHR